MIADKGFADIHTHILPNTDDGSSSVEESLAMLAELQKQGVSTVAVTPHFYADRDNPDRFIERSRKSFALLNEKLDSGIRVLPGAEVCYYQGISKTEALPNFAIGTTKMLLLEMPFCDWSDSVINEIYSIQRGRGLQVVIAHIDRYISRKNMRYVEDMLYYGILFQINAGAFLEKRRRSEALSLLNNRIVRFVASDCHNMTSRPPNLSEAFEVIENKLGYEYIRWLLDNSELFFQAGGAAD